jgi:hypothetical protein
LAEPSALEEALWLVRQWALRERGLRLAELAERLQGMQSAIISRTKKTVTIDKPEGRSFLQHRCEAAVLVRRLGIIAQSDH